METKRISPFEYVPNSLLIEEVEGGQGISKEQLEKNFNDRIYQRTEYALLESLYRYPYLTKKTMERFADERMKDRRYAGYDQMIRQLVKDGCLRRFFYEDTRFYRLSDGAREFLQTKLDPQNRHKIVIPAVDKVEDVLESASLAQWHLSAVYGGGVKKACFGEMVKIRKDSLYLPSYLEIEKKNIRYRVLSYAVPKVGLKMESFLDNIISVKEALGKWAFTFKREIFLVVLVCSSTHEMMTLAQILDNLKATSKIPIYFVAETNTAFSKGIDLLYRAVKLDDQIKLETISVKE